MTAESCSRVTGGGTMRSAVRRLTRVLPSAMLGAALALTAVVPAAKAAPVDVEPTPWAAPANGESAATITPDTEIDPSTIADWRKWIEEAGTMTTNNVGRVWTDKSVYNDDLKLTAGGPGATVVKGDDDFIVALSALSSYSNLTTTSSKPLDIVLMLDMSGSMKEYAYTYKPVYAGELSRDEIYYIDLNGTYQEVEYNGKQGGWGYTNRGEWFGRWQRVNPKTSADDNGNTQFYKAVQGEKKIAALRNAVEGFINSTAAANEKIADPAKRHHLSVAKFASEMTSDKVANDRNQIYPGGAWNDTPAGHYTQRVTPLVSIDNKSKAGVISKMKSVEPNGATAADSALSFSKRILDGMMSGDEPREGAQKVVIFFTDGEPNHLSGFDRSVANAAITNAGALKTANTMVYSIGMFGGANPDDTGATGSHRFNAYMNGVSSNYPNATSFENLGQRVDPKKDYYFAAGDADQLNQIFQDIFTDIEQQSTGSPTLVEGSDPTEGGYITFNDQLGSYMTVSGFKKILFANNQYEQVEKKDNPDGTITYTFTGTHDADANDPDHPYKTVDLRDILITVYPGSDAKTGDRVTVKIPAADIPISKYKIMNENGNTEFEYVQAYPLVVTYGVKVKDEVADLIGKPDADMSAYMAANTTGEGKLAFYSNAFEKNARDGLTTASFTPSLGNNFNRYVEDTLLYSDADCTNLVDYRDFSPENNDYYYKRTQYVKEKGGTGAREETLKIALRHGPEVSVLDVKDGDGYKYVAQDAEGHAYIVAGAPRIQRVSSDISTGKTSNTTGTAATSNNPYWEQNEDGVYDHITIKLGNNGKKEVALPGALSVTKKATVAAGSVGPVDQDGASTLDKMNFKVTVKMAGLGEQKEFSAAVVDAEGKTVSDPRMKVSFANGSWGQNLKNGETLHIYGLPAGATYTVEELDADMPEGFELKSVTDAQGKEENNKGTIVGGDTEALVLNNEYKAAATEEQSGLFTAQKVFGDWDNVKKDASFDIRMIATDWPGRNEGVDPTFPKDADVIDGKHYKYVSHIVKKSDPEKGKPFDFGGISFTQAGTYVYNIGEYVPGTGAADRLPGVNYSNEMYRVTIVVKDDGEGKLVVESSKMQKLMSAESWGDAIEPAVAVITNTYNINEAPVDLEGFKDYTDETGGNPLTPAKFTFAITPLTQAAPVPMSWRANKYEPFEKLGNPDYPDAYKSQNYQTAEINLGTLLFTGDHIKDGDETTYVYKLQEVPGSEVGMTYDGSVYYAHVTVRAVTGDAGVTVEAELKYTHDEAGNNLVDPDDPSGAIVFTNVYKAQNEDGRAHASVNGSKTLTGRNMADGETFGFGLSAADPATQRAVDNGAVALPVENATVSGACNGEEEPFSFGDLTFSKVGTYKFNVSELAWNGERIPADGTRGMRFDRHPCGVTVDVTLDKAAGELKASVTYAHGDKAVFSNSYSATTDAFSGLTVTKTLTGRAMKPKDFTFKIEAVGDAPKPTKEDASFSNVLTQASGQTEYMTGKLDNLRFTQADAGKTFEYTVSEQKPAGAQDENLSVEGFQYKGVTYDENEYKLQLAPTDNGDGTMSIATKVLDAAGDEVSQRAHVEFSNSYSASGSLVGADNLKGTKKLSGDLPDGMAPAGYNFKLEHTDASGSPVAPDPAVIEMPKETVVTSDEQGSFAFGNIVFHQSGTYYFMVSEVIPAEEDKVPGITYTPKKVLVEIVVTDNGDGTLSAKKTEGTQPLTFVNAYHANATGEVVIPVTKKVVGSASGDGQFSFELVATGKTLDAVKKGFVSADGLDANTGKLTADVPAMADGDSKEVSFAGLTFSEPGEYTFQISEVIPDPVPAHWTYDKHVCNVTIKVTDRDAQLVASESYEGARDWLNIYFDENEAKDVSKQDAPQTSVDGKLVGVGDTLVYTIDWVNNAVDKNGVPVAANVAVMDKIPHGTEYVSASEGGKHENGAVTWKLDNQPAGASGTVTLTVRVTDDAVVTGSVENQASIQIGDNKVATNVTKTFVPGKSETTHPDSVKPGETVLSYQIKFHNTDGADATATVVDKLGEGLEYQAGSARVNGEPVEPAVDGSPAAGTTLTWNLSKLDAGQDVVITFNVKVAENGPNTVENQATVNEHETNVETTPFPTKDVKHVYKGDVLVDGKLVGVGETLTFKIDWWHDATLDKDNSTVTVVDKLPDGMKPKSGTISDNGSYDADKGTITWTIENAAGKHGAVAFDAEVTDAVIEAAKRGEVTNIAKVNNHASQSVSVNVPTKTVAKPEGQRGSIKVGDEVVYTINYKNTEDNAATVTITDVLPKGITYKPDSATPAASYDEANRTLTWTLADVASGGSGSVSFTGVVNEDAIKDGINNNAGIQLGENGPVISTNTESTKMGTGDLTISKKVKSAIAGVTAPDAEFTFDVTLTDAAGNQLAGTYSYEGAKQGAIANGNGKITLKHGQSVTIKGLPEGAKYKVVERKLKGFTAIADTVNGAIHKGQAEKVEFINTYTPAAVVIPGGDKGALQVKKVLKGRDWLANESYSFELKAVSKDAPMPRGTGNVATATANNQPVSFGNISFAKPGVYEYKVIETGTSADANLTFSKAEYKLVVTVKADGSALAASSILTQVKDDAGKPADKVLQVPGEVMTFTNTYKKPTQGKDVTAEGNPGTSINGQLVQVGSKLVYTINWVNDAVDESGKAVAANVTITDKIPTGTAYDEGSATNGGVYNADTNTLTWNLDTQKANASGTVSFTVEVTEAALNNKVENQASIQIGENKIETTSKPEVFVPGKKVEDANKGDIQVGDVLTYTVSYANPGKDFATVTITDKLPKGLTYVDGSASGGGSFDKAENKLTWKINDVKAGAAGTVTFEARVNESALTNGIANTANVQLGDHTPVVDTNTTPENLPKTSTLKIGKTIKLAENQGTEIDEKKEFSFKITLTDAAGNPLNEDYRYSGEGLDGGVIAAGKDGDMFKLKHGQAITIQGLPVGAKYTITEDDAAGYTPDKKTIEGVVSVDGTSQAAFVNTYSIGDGVTLAAKDGFKASKELVGRDWNGTDKFSAKLMSVNGAPMPDGAKDGVLVKQMTKDSKEVSFGDIKYTAAGEYTYTISEEVGSIGGIKYSDTIYNVKVKVTDKGDGTLAASFDGKYVANGAVEDAKPVDIAKFVNVYSAAVPQGSPVTTANLFSKVLTGRDWKKDDSFSFTITPLNGAPAPEHLEATLTGLTTAAGKPVEFGFGAINFTFDHIKDAPVVNGERTKTFVYEVRETEGSIPGVTYDGHVAKLTVTLKDNGKGVLSATTVVSNGAQFTNTYTTKPINPDGDGATAKGGIQIVKTMTGRPITAGDFEFTMAPVDDVTKAKFGDAKVIATNAAELGTGELTNTAIATTPVKTGLKFTLEDVGKTYTFKLSETKGDRKGYTYDETEHTLTFTTADNRDGTLAVTVALDGKEAAVWTSGAEITPVSVGFTNSYSAGSITVGGQGGVALTGTKQLTGRPMVAGEFHFNVTNAKDQAEPAAAVATGTNAANGTIAFTGIEYTTEKLNNDVAAGLATVDRAEKDGDVYTYTYNVNEDAAKNATGISIIQGKQGVTVKVTDNRKGKLSAEVVYSEGSMVFKNAYGTGADGTKVIALNGTKVLDVKSGNKVPDIAGKYTFTLAGSEGAPMPAKTTATNDASGNISFGEIIYTMENVFGAPVAKPEQPAVAEDKADAADAKAAEVDAKADDAVAAEAEAKPAEDESAAKAAFEDEPMVASAQRSKTFTYTVTESGSVAGVSNDPVATKTIKVKVTDNGDGTLTVDKQAESNKTDFTFTNTYSVKPFDSTLTGKGGFAITKTLDGRDLREGEFEFALVSQGEGEQTVVTAKNDANGKVVFPAISFNEPGEYRYRLAEVDGGLGGVTYDTTVYDATATVVDNGDGTMGVTWSVNKDGKALEGKEIVFANSYKAVGTSITFNAAKVLTGRELKKGEFTFELRDANGKVLQTVKNGALTEGGYAPIAFDPITYDEPGTYDYRIVEVKGDAEGITYDETVFTYHVVVTDDGNGQLQVEWTVGETGAPVFQNGFVKPEDPKPADPAKPADPGNGGSGDKLIQTGDNALVGMFTAAFAGIAAIGAGFTARRKKK